MSDPIITGPLALDTLSSSDVLVAHRTRVKEFIADGAVDGPAMSSSQVGLDVSDGVEEICLQQAVLVALWVADVKGACPGVLIDGSCGFHDDGLVVFGIGL